MILLSPPAMSFLRKLTPKTLNSLPVLTVTRRFTSQNSAVNPFPDDPTSAYYDDLAAAAGRSGDFDALRDLLNKRVQDGCFNTRKTFNFITNADSSLALLDDLIRTLSRLNQGFTRKSAFDSLITRLCKLNGVDESLRVVDVMARGGYGLNAVTFYPVLNLLTRKKTMDEAWHVVDLMERLNVRLDLTAYNFFLMSYCFSGDLNSAAGVLRKMEEEDGMAPDTRTYDALVLGACKAGKVEGAMVLLRRMVDDGVHMLYSTHMYVLEALLEMRCYEQAVRYVKSFSGKDKVMDTENFGCLASKLIKLKKFDEAKLVLEEMNQRGLPMGIKLKEFYERNVGKDKCRSSDSERGLL